MGLLLQTPAAHEGNCNQERMLVVLCCLESACNETAEGWKAFRIQRRRRAEELGVEEEPVATTTRGNEEMEASGGKEEDGSGIGTDVWSSGANEWGDGDDGFNAVDTDAFVESVSTLTVSGNAKKKKKKKKKENSEKSANSPLPVLGSQRPSVEDGDDVVIMRRHRLELPAFYIEAAHEPGAIVESSGSERAHIDELVQRYYQGEEKEAKEENASETAPNEEGGTTTKVGWSGEEYEERDDEQLFKFMSRIQRRPEQCARYGRPLPLLWPSKRPTEASISPCPLCGERRVAELQIMPPIQHYLLESVEWCKEEEDGYDQEVLTELDSKMGQWEWLTAAIYTCVCDTCNENSDCLIAEECVVVQREMN